MSEFLRVGVALDAAGWHPAAEYRPPARGPFDPGDWAALAAEAEQGRVDFLTFEDALALRDTPDTRTAALPGRPDGAVLAGGLLAATSRIGLLPTISTSFTDPARTAAALGSLDRLDHGRIGWKVQAPRRTETANFGADDLPQARIEELEASGSLGARLDAAATAVETVRVRWAAETPEPPPVAVLAHAMLPYRFAARYADLVFVTPCDRAGVAEIVAEVRRAEAREGRVGPHLRIYADLVVFFDGARRARLDARLGVPWSSDALIFNGTPGELVDLMVDWRATGLAGFRLRPGSLPDDLVPITREVLPELARRGAFPATREAETIRGLLGLERSRIDDRGGIGVRAVTWDGPDATALRAELLAELRERYRDRLPPDPARRLEPEPESDRIVYTGVAYAADGAAVGHVALRRRGGDLELKRMYVAPAYRGRGISSALLEATESVARSLGAPRIVLQTGDRQPEAVRLYERAGYVRIPVFPPYERMDFSVCFAKLIG